MDQTSDWNTSLRDSLGAFETSDFISAAAFVLAVVSLYVTVTLWRRSNRPIVTAFVTEGAGGQAAAIFNLVVANSGNRPATNVRLTATPEEIGQLLKPGASQENVDHVASNFKPNAWIPLLRNGEEISTSFGALTAADAANPWLNYGASAEITITYGGIETRRIYKTRLRLKVYAREGFGGGVWERT